MNHDRDVNGHPDEDVLMRLAEGDLPDGEAAAVQAHLDDCPACRREVDATRGVLREAAALSRGIAPPRDLWPDVEARIRDESRGDALVAVPGGAPGEPTSGDEEADSGGRVHDLTLRSVRPWLAAAVLLAALTAGVTVWLTGGAGAGDGPAVRTAARPGGQSGASAAMPVELRELSESYRPMVDRLNGVLEQRAERLPPETREVVERNLRIIDRAIAQAESALVKHPGSPDLVHALDRSYQRKIDLLRRSARLAAEL